jgi:hypothetical protein
METARSQWLTPIILASWATEIGKTAVQASLGKKFARPLLNRKSLTWWCVPDILVMEGGLK